MPPFLPQTDSERKEMLAGIGVESVSDLFQAVPEDHRYPGINLPEPLSEMEVLREIEQLAAKNETSGCFLNFLGAGAYNHFVPAVVQTGHLSLRVFGRRVGRHRVRSLTALGAGAILAVVRLVRRDDRPKSNDPACRPGDIGATA